MGKGNKFRFNEQKSKVMLTQRRKRKELHIYLNDKAFLQVQFEILGRIFNSKLTIRKHINYMAENVQNLYFHFPNRQSSTGGLKHKNLKTIYTGGILSVLLYGAPVWKKQYTKSATNHSS